MKSNRTKATDISKKVKERVWRRDRERCIFCGSHSAMPNAHYIPRSKGGLGIEQNVITACIECHMKLDQSTERKRMLKFAKEYLDLFYPGFSDEERKYRK